MTDRKKPGPKPAEGRALSGAERQRRAREAEAARKAEQEAQLEKARAALLEAEAHAYEAVEHYEKAVAALERLAAAGNDDGPARIEATLQKTRAGMAALAATDARAAALWAVTEAQAVLLGTRRKPRPFPAFQDAPPPRPTGAELAAWRQEHAIDATTLARYLSAMVAGRQYGGGTITGADIEAAEAEPEAEIPSLIATGWGIYRRKTCR